MITLIVLAVFLFCLIAVTLAGLIAFLWPAFLVAGIIWLIFKLITFLLF